MSLRVIVSLSVLSGLIFAAGWVSGATDVSGSSNGLDGWREPGVQELNAEDLERRLATIRQTTLFFPGGGASPQGALGGRSDDAADDDAAIEYPRPAIVAVAEVDGRMQVTARDASGQLRTAAPGEELSAGWIVLAADMYEVALLGDDREIRSFIVPRPEEGS